MLEILKPTLRLIPSYFEFIEEMRLQGEKIWESMIPKQGQDSEAFINRINWEESNPGINLVPQSTYWGTVDESTVVGRVVLRHQLNARLMEFGGHISYEVRPSARRCGIAKALLKKVLETPKAKEIGRLLLTCAPDNEASNKTIIANGGILEKTAYVAAWKRDTNYYWIDLNR